jgi:predicted heme/steroid binding protein
MVKNVPAARAKAQRSEDDDSDAGVGGISVLDMLRVLAGLLIVSCGLSYIIMDGSLTWGWRPWYLNYNSVRAWMVRHSGHVYVAKNTRLTWILQRGPVHITDEQLRAYDGTDPSKPIYLALNGTIYDVSANPATYGPGGSYHFFAGRDAARAFLTGCFQEDQTPDLRGVEEMYIPMDVPDDELTDEIRKKKAEWKKGMTKAKEKTLREREYRQARKKVRDGLEHWAEMFRGEKGKNYFEVGKVKREKGWLKKLPRRELCDAAKKARPRRTYEEVA